tara:strand:- start:604 stop:1305 length:702 start_codon:yes stop_codon:yes gene_type:complete
MKIFGNGFIAKNLKKIRLSNHFCFYAAGVSNSNLSNKKDFEREINEFNKFRKKINQSKIIIYISSLSVENKNLKQDKYIKNKLKIEEIIKKKIQKFIIIRLPQIIGKNNNKHTLTNSIFNTLSKNKNFILWKGSIRNLIDIDDIIEIVEKYLKNKPTLNSTINIFNPRSIAVEDLLRIFSSILNRKLKLIILNKKNKNINLKLLKKNTLISKKFYKKIDKINYIKKTIKKYYK